jgi:hypothetical protein
MNYKIKYQIYEFKRALNDKCNFNLSLHRENYFDSVEAAFVYISKQKNAEFLTVYPKICFED